ncbi:cytochrome P450 9e2-like, partial [Vespula maculifrons]
MSQADTTTAPVPNNQNGVVANNNHTFTGVIGPVLNNNNMNTARNNNNQNPLLNVRDRLFHAVFIKAALAYARTFPRPVRRFIEFIVLLKAILAFFVLTYIHIVFSRAPTNCLEHIRDDWPRDGILRVEILRNGGEDYSIEKSYAKEEKLRQDEIDDLVSDLGILTPDGFINIEPSSVDESQGTIYMSTEDNYENVTLPVKSVDITSSTTFGETQYPNLSTTNATRSPSINQYLNGLNAVESEDNAVLGEESNRDEAIQPLKDQSGDIEKVLKTEDGYIVEYSLEYGFLRLSPAARHKLKIPVKIVTLDPVNDKCFGDAFSRLILDEFLGYDDLLMASIKTLAEHEDNKGFLRNVVTGEHYRFVSMWMAKTSYLAAFFIMLVFTVSISMLLRYSHHQIFVFIVISLIYFQLTYWKKKGVPTMLNYPLFGLNWMVFFGKRSFQELNTMIYEMLPGAKYVGTMDFATPLLIVRDPDLLKDIMVKQFDHFPDHRAFVDENIDPIFGKNVFSLRGERWKEMRNTLSPSFTASKMRFMLDLVSKCSDEFVNYFIDHPEAAKEIEMKDAFTRYTTDVIATVAFGISVNSMKDRDNIFFRKGVESSKFDGLLNAIKFTLLRTCPNFMKLLGIGFLTPSTAKFFNDVVRETVQARDEKGIIRPDMIHLLMQARDKESSNLDIKDIVAQAFIFFLAGFDTSSTLMCFMVHELAVHPEIQDKLYQEINEVLLRTNGEITYEELSKMEYMEMIMNETLRKYPPAIFLDRVCVKQTVIPSSLPNGKDFTIEPDTSIWIPSFGFHHDPKYFPDPEKFDPERFNEENKQNIIPYTYLPFGMGPRRCIGERFALMETKIVIVNILKKFIIKRTSKTPDPVVFDRKSFNLKIEGGFWIMDLLQMLEFNMPVSFPAASLLTVILALVGMEAIMSEFFNDTTTAFYIILIVWIADQYDAICCHTAITKRHWL